MVYQFFTFSDFDVTIGVVVYGVKLYHGVYAISCFSLLPLIDCLNDHTSASNIKVKDRLDLHLNFNLDF